MIGTMVYYQLYSSLFVISKFGSDFNDLEISMIKPVGPWLNIQNMNTRFGPIAAISEITLTSLRVLCVL